MDTISESHLINELDEMTMSHKKNVMQIAAFQTMSDTVYGINIAKIKEFAMIKDAKFTGGLSDSPFMMGMAVLRGKPYPLVNLLRWLGDTNPENAKIENYDILVLAEFNQSLIAFPVKKIITIASKSSEDLERADTTDNKITYITKISTSKTRSKKRHKRKKEKKLAVAVESDEQDSEAICFVIDVEKMLDEVFPEVSKHKLHDFETMNKPSIKSKKILAILEDSPVASKVLEKTFRASNLNILYFNNGLEFKAWFLKNEDHALKELGCVITDIEMPMMDGYKAVEFIRSKSKTIPIIVNTSMSNIGVVKKLEDMGASAFIPKTEPLKIYEEVEKFMGEKE
ncbi:chemotaxis protein CheV [bacterium]|nr:chemotaxis protein CheV [bacterium]MBU1883563.1 chemotaxis protein CheV [bacterium]